MHKNPFKLTDAFWCICSRQLLKILWKKEKSLMMTNFPFCHNVINFLMILKTLIYGDISHVCNLCFQSRLLQNCHMWDPIELNWLESIWAISLLQILNKSKYVQISSEGSFKTMDRWKWVVNNSFGVNKSNKTKTVVSTYPAYLMNDLETLTFWHIISVVYLFW